MGFRFYADVGSKLSRILLAMVDFHTNGKKVVWITPSLLLVVPKPICETRTIVFSSKKKKLNFIWWRDSSVSPFADVATLFTQYWYTFIVFKKCTVVYKANTTQRQKKWKCTSCRCESWLNHSGICICHSMRNF